MIANAEELLERPEWLRRVWAGFRAWEQRHALSDPSCELTYGALATRVRRAVALLDTMEVPPGAVVAVVAAKQVNSIVWLLALLESGRVYLPLDPAQPASFNRDVLADAGCHAVVQPDQVPEGEPASQPVTRVVNQRESAAAYCILTSGTTGRPRLALNSHRALAMLADNIGDIATVGVGTRVAVNAPLCFDASLKQIAMLALGASVHLLPSEDRTNPELLVQRLRAKRIEVLDVTPVHLRLLIHAGLLDLPDLRTVLIGGEAIPEDLWRALAGRTRPRFVNVYGPCETGVDETFTTVQGASPSIGKPLKGVWVEVMHGAARAPHGEVGEIVIGGAGVGLGYLGDERATAERFISFARAGGSLERAFASGDLGRWSLDGRLEWMGRRDEQFKLHGVRLHPADIEHRLREMPSIGNVGVAVDHERGILVAAVVPLTPRSLELVGQRCLRVPGAGVLAYKNRHEVDYLIDEIFTCGAYGGDEIAFQEDDVILDVGANIGAASLYFASRARGVRVIALEPVPEVADLLELNFRANEIAGYVLRVAAGATVRHDAGLTYYPAYTIMSTQHGDAGEEEATVRRFILNRAEDASAGAQAVSADLDGYLRGRFEGLELRVPTVTLSDVIDEYQLDTVGLVKIDVQKSELDVLAGIRPEHWAIIEQVVVEVHEREGSVRRAADQFAYWGYRVTVRQDRSLRGTDRFHVTASRRTKSMRSVPTVDRGAKLLLAGEVKSFCQETLPPAWCPARIVPTSAVPLTPNGKTDRAAIVSLVASAAQAGSSSLEPSGEADERQQRMRSIWQELFGLQAVDLDDNFFDLGGDSVLQLRLVVRACDAGFSITPLDVIERPTIRMLAAGRLVASVNAPTGL